MSEGAHAGERVVLLSDAVAEEWARAARLDKQTLSGGLLIGSPPQDAAAPVRITGYFDLTPRESVLGMLMDFKREWRRLQHRANAIAARDALMGWLLIGDPEELVLTPQIQLLHRSLFNLPWHVGVVVDASTERVACFGVDADRRLRNVRCELTNRASTPSTDSEPEAEP